MKVETVLLERYTVYIPFVPTGYNIHILVSCTMP